MSDDIRISVLLPTRGRPNGMRNALHTLHALASRPETIEYVLRTDDDDLSDSEIMSYAGGLRLRRFRGKRLGYARMHDYYNGLARQARGDVLLNWNDDAEMVTPNWDHLITVGVDPKKPIVQFIRRDTLETADDTFPFTDRRIFQAVGRLSGHCNCDTWLSYVARDAGVRVFRNDIVFHHHRLDDQLMIDNQAAVKIEHPKFDLPEMVAERAIDTKKITQLLEKLSYQ